MKGLKKTMENNANIIALVLLYGVIIAIITEVIKYFDKNEKLSDGQIQLITLAMGIGLGLGTMYFAELELWMYVALGIGSAWVSTGVYEHALKWAMATLGIGGK